MFNSTYKWDHVASGLFQSAQCPPGSFSLSDWFSLFLKLSYFIEKKNPVSIHLVEKKKATLFPHSVYCEQCYSDHAGMGMSFRCLPRGVRFLGDMTVLILIVEPSPHGFQLCVFWFSFLLTVCRASCCVTLLLLMLLVRSYVSLVLICSALAITDVEHTFIYLLFVWTSLFLNIYLVPFPIFTSGCCLAIELWILCAFWILTTYWIDGERGD